MFTSNTICVLLGCGQGQPFSAKQMFLSESCWPECGRERERNTKCSRLVFSCTELLPSGVIRQICSSRHFLSTQTTRLSDDRVHVCQVLFSVMELPDYVGWQRKLHHVKTLFLTVVYWLEGCVWHFLKNEWHIKTCCSLTKKNRYKTHLPHPCWS